MPTEPTFSDYLQDHCLFALDHGFNSIEDNAAPLIPFVMALTTDDEKILRRFVTENYEDGVAHAKQFVVDNSEQYLLYAIAYDGYITVEDKKYDAIFVEAGESIAPDAMVLCLRYELKGLFRKKNHAVGNPMLVEVVKSTIFK